MTLVRTLAAVLGIGLWTSMANSDDRAGDFTHYVLALSWNASWCRIEGDARDADQCDPRHDIGFTLHGLWPQGDDGWPEYCRTQHRDPTRAQSRKMADIMGSPGLAWYQWKKHGRCADLPAQSYYDLAREAYDMIRRPELLRKVTKPVKVSPDVIEKAFLEANPGLKAHQLAVTCKDGFVQEVRVCLSKGLVPRSCSRRTERGCRAKSVVLPPMR